MRWKAIVATTLIAVGCASDPRPVEEKPDDPIVAARIDRAKIDRSASGSARPALPAHPTDPVEPTPSNGSAKASASSSSSVAANERSSQGGGSGSPEGSSSEGGSGGSGGGDGEGSEGSGGENASGSRGQGESGSAGESSGAASSTGAAGSSGDALGGSSPQAGSVAPSSISPSQAKATKAGASSGSGSNSGEAGSGSGASSGAPGPPAGEGGENASTSASGESAEGASSGSADSGRAGDGSAGAAGSGDSGQSASGSGGPTEAGGAGAGGGIGEQGTVESASSDHVQPESGGGGTQGASNTAPGTPPAWIEPTAMDGSGRGDAAGGAGGPGSSEARTDEQASASGGGGAQSGGAGEGRAFDSPEPAAPAGSLGVAQASDASAESSREDFLDAALDVRDYPAVDPAAKDKDAAPPIESDPSSSTPPAGADVLTGSPADPSVQEAESATPPIDADASADRPDGSIEASDGAAARSPEPAVPGANPSRSTGGEAAARDSGGSGSVASGASQPATDRVGDPAASGADPGRDAITGDRSAPQPAASDRDTADLDGSASEPSPRARALIDLPQIDVEPIETRSLRERSEAAIPDDPRWVLRGAWEQANRRMNEPDFAPGGYERNLIAIDPDEGVLRTYRVFGDGAYVAAGEYRVEIRPEGTLDLRPDPRRPHLFASEPFTIAGDTVLPPREPIERPRSWTLRDGVLEIEGRRFVRIERGEFEAVARGDDRASDGVLAGGDWSIAPSVPGDDDATPAVDFFGTSIVGRHICFVVDVSGSMAGPRLQAALAELARSIESLPQDRFFYVLFFSGSKLVLEDRWLRATKSSTRSFVSKLADIEAQGGTEPASSLDHAFTSLAPVPDEIHFMTDGLIPQGIPERLRALNGGRVRTVIHTYAFGERASETMLQAIATEHGGRYRFVPE